VIVKRVLQKDAFFYVKLEFIYMIAFSSGEGGTRSVTDEEVALSRIIYLKRISPKALF
jgi:hypothetical protein